MDVCGVWSRRRWEGLRERLFVGTRGGQLVFDVHADRRIIFLLIFVNGDHCCWTPFHLVDVLQRERRRRRRRCVEFFVRHIINFLGQFSRLSSHNGAETPCAGLPQQVFGAVIRRLDVVPLGLHLSAERSSSTFAETMLLATAPHMGIAIEGRLFGSCHAAFSRTSSTAKMLALSISSDHD